MFLHSASQNMSKSTKQNEVYELQAVSRNIGTSTPKPTKVVTTLNSPDQNGDNINVASVDTTPLGSYEEEK
jgi:hypothetical protein